MKTIQTRLQFVRHCENLINLTTGKTTTAVTTTTTEIGKVTV